MKEKTGSYQVLDLTPGRRIWLNTLDLSWTPHAIYGLLEVDVTLIRRAIAAHKERTGETLSFTGYLSYCLAHTVDEDKSVQAFRKGGRQLAIFDDVDVTILVEGQIGEKKALMGHIIGGANHKSYLEIHEEIRRVQSEPVPAGRGMPGWFRSVMLLPGPFSSLAKALIALLARLDPARLVSMTGTVAITSVGMFGGGHSGWGLTPTGTPLGLVVGGIAQKPAFVDDRLERREIMSLTVVFDHNVVDGAPAARFTRRLIEMIECGEGLEELSAPIPAKLA